MKETTMDDINRLRSEHVIELTDATIRYIEALQKRLTTDDVTAKEFESIYQQLLDFSRYSLTQAMEGYMVERELIDE